MFRLQCSARNFMQRIESSPSTCALLSLVHVAAVRSFIVRICIICELHHVEQIPPVQTYASFLDHVYPMSIRRPVLQHFWTQSLSLILWSQLGTRKHSIIEAYIHAWCIHSISGWPAPKNMGELARAAVQQNGLKILIVRCRTFMSLVAWPQP